MTPIEVIQTMLADPDSEGHKVDAHIWLEIGGATGWTLDELKRDDKGRYHVVKMQGRMVFPCPHFTASFDAAMTIGEEELADWYLSDLTGDGNEYGAEFCKNTYSIDDPYVSMSNEEMPNIPRAVAHVRMQALDCMRRKEK